MAILESATELLANPNHINAYGYVPFVYVCAIFLGLFSLSTMVHVGQAVWSRKWYLLLTIVPGGVGEIIGWSARLWSASNVYNPAPYLIQISTTVMAPTFLAAANFIILGTIINLVGAQYSRLPATYYGIVFVTIDLIALGIQAIGGGMASAATQQINGDPDKGGHVMLGGIVIQQIEIVIYVALAVDFFLNYAKHKSVRSYTTAAATVVPVKPTTTRIPSLPAGEDGAVVGFTTNSANNVSLTASALETARATLGGDKDVIRDDSDEMRMNGSMKLMSCGLAFSTLMLFIRTVYRTIELSNGWNGRIIQTQVYFNVLDGAMIVLAMYTLNFIHPGFLL